MITSSELVADLVQKLGHWPLQGEPRRKLEIRSIEEPKKIVVGPIRLRLQRTHTPAAHDLGELIDENSANAAFSALGFDSDRVQDGDSELVTELAAQDAGDDKAAQRTSAHDANMDVVVGMGGRGREAFLEEAAPGMPAVDSIDGDHALDVAGSERTDLAVGSGGGGDHGGPHAVSKYSCRRRASVSASMLSSMSGSSAISSFWTCANMRSHNSWPRRRNSSQPAASKPPTAAARASAATRTPIGRMATCSSVRCAPIASSPIAPR